MPKSPVGPHIQQTAEIFQNLQRLKSHLGNASPQDYQLIQRYLSRSHAKAELGDLSAPAVFYPAALPLYGQTEPLTMSRLSRAMGVPLSTATRLVDWLVTHGYAERSSDASDRRVVRVALTRSGCELYEAINLALARRLEKILSRLNSAERKQLVALLRKVVEITESEE